ncbi:polysaccharide deacetylase [Shimia sp. R11_0]|uniref:polysaccharide deacetylase n=1 Tax=Shimia sp. R11_0 TaxID=2821096 RepID=UPI001ADB9947|nr:polysaccharide deacetylase [Shimia sp. R11_0]
MKVDWHPLRRELTLWRTEGRELPFWWRDDDAVAPTEALEQLAALSAAVAMPVHLAIVPKHATEALAKGLSPQFVPVVHGWSHISHSPDGVKNAEFGAGREAAAVADLKAAYRRMTTLFGARLAPMFVPPWNRMDDALFTHLAPSGFDAVSAYNARTSPEAAPGVAQINTHLDPIFWRGTRGLVDPEVLVSQIVTLLKERRGMITDNQEPLGYLTHHLVHDADIWEFSRQFLQEMGGGPVRLYRHDEKGIS